MSAIYLVCWAQSGQFGLSAVVLANDEKQAIDAVSMYEPENVKCIKVGEADKPAVSPQVICQESL
jgi:hypothetical protein